MRRNGFWVNRAQFRPVEPHPAGSRLIGVAQGGEREVPGLRRRDNHDLPVRPLGPLAGMSESDILAALTPRFAVAYRRIS